MKQIYSYSYFTRGLVAVFWVVTGGFLSFQAQPQHAGELIYSGFLFYVFDVQELKQMV